MLADRNIPRNLVLGMSIVTTRALIRLRNILLLSQVGGDKLLVPYNITSVVLLLLLLSEGSQIVFVLGENLWEQL